MIFDRETATLILCSFALVVSLLLFMYRSFWSAAVLMTPLVAGIGPSYGVIYLSYNEINPVVMGATGILLGLGAEYGEHLWGRIREELDRGCSRTEALERSYAQTGPPVVLGGLTGNPRVPLPVPFQPAGTKAIRVLWSHGTGSDTWVNFAPGPRNIYHSGVP